MTEKLKHENSLYEKRKKNKELSFELLNQAQSRKISLLNEKTQSLRKSRELLEERVNRLDFNENNKKKFILDKLNKAHDEKKLSELMPKLKKNDYNYDHNLTSLKITQEYTEDKSKYNDYLSVLQKQIKEKTERELEYSQTIKEQGDI